MARSVFFSYHYQRDIMRVQTIKNHHVTKGTYTAAGFFDGSLEEKAKKSGDDVVRGMIDQGLPGSTVLCVLIGNETFTRRWVDYEVFKSIQLGMGVLGICIHKIADPSCGVDAPGPNPFSYLGYTASSGKLYPVKYDAEWKQAQYQQPLTQAVAPYLVGKESFALSSIFSVYDWVDDDGYNNFETWVERAAQQARK